MFNDFVLYFQSELLFALQAVMKHMSWCFWILFQIWSAGAFFYQLAGRAQLPVDQAVSVIIELGKQFCSTETNIQQFDSMANHDCAEANFFAYFLDSVNSADEKVLLPKRRRKLFLRNQNPHKK